MKQKAINELVLKGKLVTAKQLLEEVFETEAMPSLRWLRTQTKNKAIPFVRIGHLVFFDIPMVKESLASKNLVRGRFGVKASAGV